MPITEATRIYDITRPLAPGFPVWPGDPPIEFCPVSRIAHGGSANVTQLRLRSHCGTHVDPPRHFFDEGPSLSDLPIERWIGPCQVIGFGGEIDRIEPGDLESAGIATATTRLLVKTRNSERWRRGHSLFETDFVALTSDAARWIVTHDIALIGIDALSFERFDEPDGLTHKIILGNNVVAVEGLDLSAVAPGFYDLVCLPLNISNGDGAPARVILLDYANT